MKNMHKREIYWLYKDKYNEKWNPKLIDDTIRLKNGEPIDYIIGWKPFLNCKIDLSKKSLIPRVETEFWVEKALLEINKRKEKLSIADFFSGSGCIGVSILKNTKNSKVIFVEIDKILLKQIRINLKLNRINSSNYKIVHSNIFKNLKGTYDFILANPPYIPITRKNSLSKGVIKFEPAIALFSGKDGLNIIKKFLKTAPKYLKPNGQIWMEFDVSQKKELNKLLKKYGYINYKFYKDQYKKWRYVMIKK